MDGSRRFSVSMPGALVARVDARCGENRSEWLARAAESFLRFRSPAAQELELVCRRVARFAGTQVDQVEIERLAADARLAVERWERER